MNKICTTLEQSKKLLELGLSPESADMSYEYMDECDGNFPYYSTPVCYPPENNKDIPCWSLAALLGLMPKIYEYENDPEDGGCQPNLCKGWDNNQWHIVYRPSLYITDWYDDPLDATFQMVVWLKENDKI